MLTSKDPLIAFTFMAAIAAMGACEATAQCMRGGGETATTTGTSTLASLNTTSGLNTASNPALLMMQRAAQIPSQYQMMARRMAARQAQLQAARNAQAMPYRLARAEARRAARAERIAARLREAGDNSYSSSYALVSTSARPRN